MIRTFVNLIVFHSLMKYYGRIISLRLGSFRVVIAASPESVKEVLITKSADFAGRPPQASYFYTTVGESLVFALKFAKLYNINLISETRLTHGILI